MNKRKIKKKVKIIFFGSIILIIGIIIIIKLFGVLNSNQHKLSKLGYSKEETKIILDLKKDQIDDILKLEYDENIPNLLQSKYFLYKNFDKYIKYHKDNYSLTAREVVEIINVNNNEKEYTNIKSADVSKGILTLVNKYYALNEKYSPKNIVNISLQHSYSDNKIIKEVNDAFVLLYNDAKKLGYNIIVSTSYKDYSNQEKLYTVDKNNRGTEHADKYIARPGHSEHQLGLAIDVDLYNKKYDKFEDTDEYKWLIDNAHKYGFILRYPKDKVNITGYNFEPWHYRYVGNDISEYIYKNKITFDEYYAYYIEK